MTFPEKYLDVGIAEQNMIGIAAGLASEDYNVIPMGHSLIPFYMKYIGLNMSDKEITHDMINKIRKPKQYEKLKGEYNV